MSISTLSEKTSIPESTIVDILEAKEEINLEIALAFERVLGYSKQFWLNLEKQYQGCLARKRNLARLDPSEKQQQN